MVIRRRKLKADFKGRYRPYLGYRVDGKQQRFTLGTDEAEAERRLSRLYELWEENVEANGGEAVWSPLALSFALEIAAGKRQIEYPFQPQMLDADDPAAEYAQMIHVERQRFPSLNIVPADSDLYVDGVRRNRLLVGKEVSGLQERMKELGALDPKQTIPATLASGSLHEALDAYAEAVACTLHSGTHRRRSSVQPRHQSNHREFAQLIESFDFRKVLSSLPHV